MRLCRGLYNVPVASAGRVVTVGNFDGVHRGHQLILQRLVREGRRLGGATAVIIFEPQPMEFFLGAKAPARLMRWHDKWEALRQFGIDEVVVLRFAESLRQLTAEDFVRTVLVSALQTQLLLVGDDFHCGCDRQGDYAFLSRIGPTLGMQVMSTDSVQAAGARVSSTLLRDALQTGAFLQVQQYLGHAYGMSGRVVQGDQLGRTLGVPTANILLKRQVSPLQGVFAVRVLCQGRSLQGVANVGSRPTVSGIQPRLEVHLFDFSEDIYGQRLYVEFVHKLREERRFGSLAELKAAIALDIACAREWFSAQPLEG